MHRPERSAEPLSVLQAQRPRPAPRVTPSPGITLVKYTCPHGHQHHHPSGQIRCEIQSVLGCDFNGWNTRKILKCVSSLGGWKEKAFGRRAVLGGSQSAKRYPEPWEGKTHLSGFFVQSALHTPRADPGELIVIASPPRKQRDSMSDMWDTASEVCSSPGSVDSGKRM